jgi:hypothetical protein
MNIEEEKIINAWLGKLNEELDNDEECLWMSFCDPDKPEGEQFLGVIITKDKGFAHAVTKINSLGINPGGEILCYETDPEDIPEDCFDRLLSYEELISRNLCFNPENWEITGNA